MMLYVLFCLCFGCAGVCFLSVDFWVLFVLYCVMLYGLRVCVFVCSSVCAFDHVFV